MNQLQEKRPGRLSAGENKFCVELQQFLQAAIEKHTPFEAVVVGLSIELTILRRWNYDVDAAIAGGYDPMLLARNYQGNLAKASVQSDREIEFLEDAKGLAAFAARNGVGFDWVIGAIGHDVGEIRNHNDSLAETLADFVSPKVSGWAKRNSEPVGDLEE